MKPISYRVQLRLVAASYAAVLTIAVGLIAVRYLQYVWHPDDVAAYGGMWAGGDMMLELFICFLLMIPTVFLVFVIRKSETASETYGKVLFGLSLTAPLSAALIAIPAIGKSNMIIGYFFLFRLLASPVVVVWLIVSRLLARFDRQKRWTSYALLVEGVTLVLIAALLFGLGRTHRG
ncbi:MAG: hypothetical protein WBS24_06130 [Terriglobales bacterium]